MTGGMMVAPEVVVPKAQRLQFLQGHGCFNAYGVLLAVLPQSGYDNESALIMIIRMYGICQAESHVS